MQSAFISAPRECPHGRVAAVDGAGALRRAAAAIGRVAPRGNPAGGRFPQRDLFPQYVSGGVLPCRLRADRADSPEKDQATLRSPAVAKSPVQALGNSKISGRTASRRNQRGRRRSPATLRDEG